MPICVNAAGAPAFVHRTARMQPIARRHVGTVPDVPRRLSEGVMHMWIGRSARMIRCAPATSVYARWTTAVSCSVLLGTAARAQVPAWDLLVSSRGTSAVKRYDGHTGAYIDDFVPSGSGGLSVTQEVAIGPDSQVYVTGRGNSQVLRFDRRTGAFLGGFTTGYVLDNPTKTSFLPDGRLLVSQWGVSRSAVAAFDARSGAFLGEVTPHLNQPMQHLPGDGGDLLVALYGAGTVSRFTAGGVLLGPATRGRGLQGPTNLWYRGDDLFVVDWTAGSVERFDRVTGDFRGTHISGLRNAEGWAYGPDGHLYVAEWSANVVRKFDGVTGAPLGVFASGGGLSQPNSLVFAPRAPDFSLRATLRGVTSGGASVGLVVSAANGTIVRDSITLRCVNPVGYSCQFAPTAVVPGAGEVNVEVEVVRTTGARALGVFAFVLLGGMAGRRPRVRWLTTACLAWGVAACGGDGGTPPVETTRLTIAATGGGVERLAVLDVVFPRT